MSTNTKLRAEWGRIWTKDRAKTHIMPTCPYVGPDHRPRDVAAFPESHIDLCEWCEERFETWRDGMGGDGDRCDRCGCRYDGMGPVCETCHMAVSR